MSTKTILASLGLTVSALTLGASLSSASIVQSVLTTPVSGVDGSDFFVGNAPLDKLPYELAVVRSTSVQAASQSGDKSADGQLNTTYYSVFDNLSIVPELIVLAIDGAKFQRELGTATILDGAYRAGTVYGPVASDFTLHYASAAADLPLSLDDEALSALSSIIDDESAVNLEKEMGSASAEGSVAVPAEVTTADIEPSIGAEVSDDAGLNAANSENVNASAEGGTGSNGNGLSLGATAAGASAASQASGSSKVGASDVSGKRRIVLASAETGSGLNSFRRGRAGTIQGIRLRPMSLEAQVSNDEGPVSSVPLPAALPLLASALAGIGFMARRRKAAKA